MSSQVRKGVDQDLMRLSNLGTILREFATNRQLSRTALASATGLTRPAISGMSSQLIEHGLLRELGPVRRQTSGRPSTILELDGSAYAVLVIEIVPGHLTITTRDLALRLISRTSQPIVSKDLPEVTLGLAQKAALDVRETLAAQGRCIIASALALPALLAPAAARVVAAPSLGWYDADVQPFLLEGEGQFIIDNRANFAALAESYSADVKTVSPLVHLEVGTAVGAGIVLNGEIMRGSEGFAGAIGHIQVDPTGPMCHCGRRGCLEALAGLESLILRTIPDSIPQTVALEDQNQILRHIASRATRGDTFTLDGLAETARWIARGASVLINMLNPKVLSLGGYTRHLQDWLLPEIVAKANEHVVAPNLGECKIQTSELGSEATEYGAAIMLQSHTFSPGPLEQLLRRHEKALV